MKKTHAISSLSIVCVVFFTVLVTSCGTLLPVRKDSAAPEGSSVHDDASTHREKRTQKKPSLSLEVQMYFNDEVAKNIQTVFSSPLSSVQKVQKLHDEAFLSDLANTLLQKTVFDSERLHKPPSITVIILETDELNSFAAGYTTILITRGLLDCLSDTDTQVNSGYKASILAHEIAHLSLGQALYPVTVSSLSDTKEVKEQILHCLFMLMDSGYDKAVVPSAEFGADAEAIAILEKNGYTIQDYRGFLGKIAACIDYERPDIAKTHPGVPQRLERIRK